MFPATDFHLPLCLAICLLQEQEMVLRMLQFRRNMLSVLQNSFAGHADFTQALKEGEGFCFPWGTSSYA